jgi:hypothetical protein
MVLLLEGDFVTLSLVIDEHDGHEYLHGLDR